MPTYNSRATLQQALDSIVKQTHRPIEIIVIDDASDDDSYAFAKAYSQQHSTSQLSFKILSNSQNSGAGISRNKGVTIATGDYIAFLDADDLWKTHKLQAQLEAMKAVNASVCYGAYELFKDDPDQPVAIHKVFQKLTYKKLHKANYLGNLTGIYDVHALGKIAIPSLRKRQDWAMWLDALKISGHAIGIQEPLASYRLGNGISSNKWKLIKYNHAVYRQHLGYSAVKSLWMMIIFFYEQFVVKRSMVEKI